MLVDFASDFGLACPQKRCDLGSLGTLDFSHDHGTTFHLDTADAYTDLAGAITHGIVDYFLGNVWYQVIPRH